MCEDLSQWESRRGEKKVFFKGKKMIRMEDGERLSNLNHSGYILFESVAIKSVPLEHLSFSWWNVP